LQEVLDKENVKDKPAKLKNMADALRRAAVDVRNGKQDRGADEPLLIKSGRDVRQAFLYYASRQGSDLSQTQKRVLDEIDVPNTGNPIDDRKRGQVVESMNRLADILERLK
jgi:hypothetical protein